MKKSMNKNNVMIVILAIILLGALLSCNSNPVSHLITTPEDEGYMEVNFHLIKHRSNPREAKTTVIRNLSEVIHYGDISDPSNLEVVSVIQENYPESFFYENLLVLLDIAFSAELSPVLGTVYGVWFKSEFSDNIIRTYVVTDSGSVYEALMYDYTYIIEIPIVEVLDGIINFEHF
ncbi:MAG: hypothetical protein FWG20_06775, partial [Candidatus Cloacimonetes bacterium]|nr:hypothetical protein [Candidatus Cloacimonadota bacterium]